MMKTLSDEEAVASRSSSNLRLAASTSLTEKEVQVLDGILSTIRRGGDARILARSEPARSLSRKVETMKQTIERQKGRRALAAAASEAPVSSGEDA